MSNLPPDQDSEDLEDSDKTTKPRKSRKSLKREPSPEPRVSLLDSTYAANSAPYRTFLGSAQQNAQGPSQGGALPASDSPTAYQPSGLTGPSIPWRATYGSPTQPSSFQGPPYQPVAQTQTQYPQRFFYPQVPGTLPDVRPIGSTPVGGHFTWSENAPGAPSSRMTGGGSGPTADTNQWTGTPASGSDQSGVGFRTLRPRLNPVDRNLTQDGTRADNPSLSDSS